MQQAGHRVCRQCAAWAGAAAADRRPDRLASRCGRALQLELWGGRAGEARPPAGHLLHQVNEQHEDEQDDGQEGSECMAVGPQGMARRVLLGSGQPRHKGAAQRRKGEQPASVCSKIVGYALAGSGTWGGAICGRDSWGPCRAGSWPHWQGVSGRGQRRRTRQAAATKGAPATCTGRESRRRATVRALPESSKQRERVAEGKDVRMHAARAASAPKTWPTDKLCHSPPGPQAKGLSCCGYQQHGSSCNGAGGDHPAAAATGLHQPHALCSSVPAAGSEPLLDARHAPAKRGGAAKSSGRVADSETAMESHAGGW